MDTSRVVVVLTTNDVPGHHVTEVFGDVVGIVVRARDYFSNLGAKFRTVVGGEVGGYTRMMSDARHEARQRLMEAAADLGANAVLGARFDINEIGGIMQEFVAYGTAVRVEPGASAHSSVVVHFAPAEPEEQTGQDADPYRGLSSSTAAQLREIDARAKDFDLNPLEARSMRAAVREGAEAQNHFASFDLTTADGIATARADLKRQSKAGLVSMFESRRYRSFLDGVENQLNRG